MERLATSGAQIYSLWDCHAVAFFRSFEQGKKQQVPPLRRPLRLRSGPGSGRNDKKCGATKASASASGASGSTLSC
jgi:hypothetical protein